MHMHLRMFTREDWQTEFSSTLLLPHAFNYQTLSAGACYCWNIAPTSSCPSQNFSYHAASVSQWRSKSCFLIILMGNCLIMASRSHLIWSFSQMAQWSTKLHQSLSFVSLIILSVQLSNSFKPHASRWHFFEMWNLDISH